MQYNPNNQNYVNQQGSYVNQYPPMNQPPIGSNYGFSTNNTPPPYSQYPQQPGAYATPGTVYYGQTPGSNQQNVTMVPVRPAWDTTSTTPITSNLRTFLIISGILLIVWGVLTLGLEIGTIVQFYRSYYSGFWAGGCLISTGITFLVVSCRPAYDLRKLMVLLAFCTFFCMLAFIFSIVHMSKVGCYYTYSHIWSCDTTLLNRLKIAALVFYVVALLHTIANIILINRAQKTAAASHDPYVLSPK